MITYDFEYDGELLGFECETKEAAANAANEWWANRCLDDGMRDNETRDDAGFVVTLDENNEEIAREKSPLEYTCEPSDYDEHRTY